MKYRAEVDGMRAIAVLGVIVYHAELTIGGRGLLPGGFLGVDVFFVISGYLITRLILAEIFDTGSFSFRHFYERRARRILPMLLTVMLVSLPFAIYYLLPAPSQFIDYCKSILWAIFFGSNFFFYFSATEYAADTSLLNPFLHTWSLGVEEQFYIVFPVLAMVFHKFLRQHLLAIFVVLFLLSLQFSELMSTRQTDLNFYLPMSRFWELLAGSIVAYVELKHGRFQNSLVNAIMPTIGVYMIVWSMFFINDQTPHPSFITLIPVIGSALVIMFATQNDLTGKVLGSKPFVGIGLISYSAYLWHFPIFAFARIADSSPSMLDKMIWIALTLALSCASYFFIEQPFRKKKVVSVQKLILAIAASTAVVLVSITAFYPNIDEFEARARSEASLVMDQGGYLKVWTKYKNALGPTGFETNDRTNVLIVGDSHATDMYSAFQQNAELFPAYDFAITHADNPNPRRPHYEVFCFNNRFLKRGDEKCEGVAFTLRQKYRDSDIVMLATHWIPQDIAVLESIIERVRADGKELILVSNNLEIRDQARPIRQFIGEHGRFPNEAEKELLERETYKFIESDAYLAGLNEQLREISAKHDVKYLIKHEIYCDDEQERCLVLTPTNDIIHWDYAHFTVGAAKFIGGRIAELNWFR